MLQKLRTRYPIDLPVEGWKRRRVILAVLGSIALLFVLLPLAASLLGGALDRKLLIAAGVGIGTLALVLLVGAVKGKPGWDR